jgi:hypothetical protein
MGYRFGARRERHRPLRHCIEHRREVARGGIDHLQYLGGRDLLLQGLVALSKRFIPLGSTLGKLTL